MYNVVQNVIASKRYELKDILSKIDTLWVQGSITEEQRTELIQNAQRNARVENSIDILNKLYELERRVTALEKASSNDESTENETETVTYPTYEVGKWYVNGDVVVFEGSNYKCIAPEGVTCVWSPTEYPAYWELVVSEEADGTTEENPEVETDEPLTDNTAEDEPLTV